MKRIMAELSLAAMTVFASFPCFSQNNNKSNTLVTHISGVNRTCVTNIMTIIIRLYVSISEYPYLSISLAINQSCR